MEVNKCSVVNLKFAIPRFFDIFGLHHPDNQRPTVYYRMVCCGDSDIPLTHL